MTMPPARDPLRQKPFSPESRMGSPHETGIFVAMPFPSTTDDAVAADSSAARPRALVIDDDPVFRSLLANMLKRDYSVVATADGKDGFELALDAPPDVAVIDIQMPVWDGLRTMQAFHEHPALKRVALVVLTSDTSRETLLAAINAGAEDYVSKIGLSRIELLEKLSRILDRRRVPPTSHIPAPAARHHARSSRELIAAATVAAVSADAERLQDLIDSWE